MYMTLIKALQKVQLRVNPVRLLLLIIIILAIFLRFYNLPNRYDFDSDAIRDANVAYYAAYHFKLPLTGPFSSFGPFTFGPFYYYALALSYYIFPSLYAPWILVTLLSVIVVFIMYKIGQELEGEAFGIMLAFFVALSTSQINIATGLSNLNFIPFFTSLSLLLFILCVKKDRTRSLWYPFLFGISLGIGINMHYQSAGLLILPILLFIYKGIRYYRQMLIFILGLFLTTIPLLIFNTLDHGSTIEGMYISYKYIRPKIYIPNSWTIYLKTFWPTLWANAFGLPTWTGYLLIPLTVLVTAWRFWKRQINAPLLLLAIAFFINFLSLRYFWGQRNVEYFYYLQPFIFIFTALVLVTIYKYNFGKYIILLLLAVMGLTMLFNDLPLLQATTSNKNYLTGSQIILHRYPMNSISIYTCSENPESAEGYALDYIFANENRLQENGTKLGVFGDRNRCNYPLNKDLTIHIATFSAKVTLKTYPIIKNTSVVDFTLASDSALQTAHWQKMSPESIYNSVINWWK